MTGPGGPAGEPADADVAASADVTAADVDAAWELFDGAGGFIDGEGGPMAGSPLGFEFPRTETGDVGLGLVYQNKIIASAARAGTQASATAG